MKWFSYIYYCLPIHQSVHFFFNASSLFYDFMITLLLFFDDFQIFLEITSIDTLSIRHSNLDSIAAHIFSS